MWIRSQDKEKLSDLRVFDIDKTGYTNMPYKVCGYSDDWANTNNFHIDLGHYSSKEKALKVLDMIEKHIEGLNKRYIAQDKGNPRGYEILDNMYIPIQKGKASIIFQMPQDDEI